MTTPPRPDPSPHIVENEVLSSSLITGIVVDDATAKVGRLRVLLLNFPKRYASPLLQSCGGYGIVGISIFVNGVVTARTSDDTLSSSSSCRLDAAFYVACSISLFLLSTGSFTAIKLSSSYWIKARKKSYNNVGDRAGTDDGKKSKMSLQPFVRHLLQTSSSLTINTIIAIYFLSPLGYTIASHGHFLWPSSSISSPPVVDTDDTDGIDDTEDMSSFYWLPFFVPRAAFAEV
jgi:hypothetical protein